MVRLWPGVDSRHGRPDRGRNKVMRVQDAKPMWCRSEGALLSTPRKSANLCAAGPEVRIRFSPAGSLGSPSTRTLGRVAFGHSAVNAGAVTTAHASSSSASIVRHSRSCRLTAQLGGVAVYLLLSRPKKSKKIYLSICARLVNT
jgi:hypothetical protein